MVLRDLKRYLKLDVHAWLQCEMNRSGGDVCEKEEMRIAGVLYLGKNNHFTLTF